jgi:dephospho-CoA kinase
MRLIGLTGNIASGKSIVADLFAERGATIIDADVLAREAVTKGSPALDAIVARWGSEVPHYAIAYSRIRRISTR